MQSIFQKMSSTSEKHLKFTDTPDDDAKIDDYDDSADSRNTSNNYDVSTDSKNPHNH